MTKQSTKSWAHLTSKRGPLKHDKESPAHQLYRAKPGHEHHSAKGADGEDDEQTEAQVNGVTSPGSTGVLYVTERAQKNGFSPSTSSEWANFGQGAPETGPIPGGSERPGLIDINALGGDAILEYAPTTGTKELREAVAHLYNVQYRKGKKSQYAAENVCIVPGGRAGLTRVASVIGSVFVSYQVPDTAYDQMLSSFKSLIPIPTTLNAEDAYKLDIDKLKRNIHEQGLSVVVASNPRNPTGQVIVGDELSELVQIAREDNVTMVLDEFYSWYSYEQGEGAAISAAEYIEDVNRDPVVLIDGLTKNWRLPGFRCCWVVGPRKLIDALGQAGSFLDGGASHVIQAAALPLLEPKRVESDRLALQRHFKHKRDHVLARLAKMGLEVKNPPTSTFYIWLDLSQLPSPLNSGLTFFEACLREKVILTPGSFFDLNPSHRRNLLASPCDPFVRLSFGPALEELDRGLDGIERVLRAAEAHVEKGEDLHDFVSADTLKQ